MQIVIDIPNWLYDAMMGHREPVYSQSLGDAVRDGTPLPKGHGRLIDADETIKKICGDSCGCHLEECGYDNPCYSVARINSAPTIIEADKAESEEV